MEAAGHMSESQVFTLQTQQAVQQAVWCLLRILGKQDPYGCISLDDILDWTASIARVDLAPCA